MDILVIGDESHLSECQLKFGTRHQYLLASDHRDAERLIGSGEIVFDFIIDEEPYQAEVYSGKSAVVFVNTAKISLSQLLNPFRSEMKGKFFGFNGLPTFLNTTLFEVSVLRPEEVADLSSYCDKLGTKYALVDDRVGLVAARIIVMIINEAYITVQENTASREDIDLAMRLGTNYPFGPFEWCKRIGVKHVYELLEALYEDTKDARYKVSPLLKKEYLNSNGVL